jgi:gluconolactonase
MKNMKKLSMLLFLCVSIHGYGQMEETYPVDPASLEQPNVPKGEVLKFTFDNSKIYPGTTREVSVYIPRQYVEDKPACVYVNQDGIQWNAPVVFDNLIASTQMPITVGVFVTPGVVKAKDGNAALDRFNRSFEYDGMGDTYARFILEEILPEVEKHRTADGRAIRLSQRGNDRAIGGSSSGAVCAFTAAWERPEAFSRVFSAIGTYVGLRGADEYPTLVRKYEPKPLRIFLQDGSNDLNIYAGDWWKANEMMERALVFSGYEVSHVWGEGQHNGKHGTAIFPQAMRWLWKDWPAPVKRGTGSNPFLNDILIPGEEWQLVGKDYKFTEGTAANKEGEIFYQDIPTSKTYKVNIDGKLTELNVNAKNASGTAFGPDGKRYTVAGGSRQILSYDANGMENVFADSISGNDIVVAANGNIYITSPDGVQKPSKIYLIKPDGQKSVVDEGLKFANGLTLSPDQTQLYVTESATHWVWAYQVQADGTLSHKQRYGYLHVASNDDNAWSDGLKCDVVGRIYVTSRIGIQVLDQTGRVNAIIPVPAGMPSNLCLGGKNFDVMYVTAGSYVYRRKVKVRGANTFEKPLKPSTPKL